MTDCKHTMKPGETRVWTGESKSPPYACGLCEMERLRSTLELARVALWHAFDEVRQSPKYVDRPSTFVGAKINEALEAIEKVREGPMMCPRGCGVEVRVGMLDYTQEVDDCAEHTDARCADALSAQLATMTKRAEEALALVHSAEELHDACLARCLAAEAKLVMAVTRFAEAMKKDTNVCGGNHRHMKEALRALGIDPSKETGKMTYAAQKVSKGRRYEVWVRSLLVASYDDLEDARNHSSELLWAEIDAAPLVMGPGEPFPSRGVRIVDSLKEKP